MIVADLFARLGFKVDKKSKKESSALLGTVKKAIVGIAAYKGVKMFTGLINETRELADNYAKMSKKVGISTEGLQQLEFAAGISGTNIDVLRTALQRMARTADDANEGSKSAKDTFKRLGISMKDASGHVRSMDDLLMESADAFAAMEDGQKKTALAQKLFGRAGAELIPLLNEGREGIGELRKEFTSLGAEIDGKTAAQFEELNDTQLRFKTVMQGLKNQIAISLLPVLQSMATSMLEWVKANRVMIKQNITKFFKAFGKFLMLLGKTIAFVFKHWEKLALLFASAKLAGAIVALQGSMTALGAASLKAGLKAAAAWLAAAAPILVLTALIAGLIYAAKGFWDFITGQDTEDSFFSIMVDQAAEYIEIIVKKFGEVFDWLAKKFDWVTDKIAGLIEDLAKATGLDSLIDKGAAGKSGKGAARRKATYEAYRERSRQMYLENQKKPILGPTAAEAGITPGVNNVTENNHISANVTVNAGAANPEETGRVVRRELQAMVRAVPAGRKKRVAR